jgi:hypothetical protein
MLSTAGDIIKKWVTFLNTSVIMRNEDRSFPIRAGLDRTRVVKQPFLNYGHADNIPCEVISLKVSSGNHSRYVMCTSAIVISKLKDIMRHIITLPPADLSSLLREKRFEIHQCGRNSWEVA